MRSLPTAARAVAAALLAIPLVATPLAAAAPAAAPLVPVAAVNGQVVPGEYVVTTKPGARAAVTGLRTVATWSTGFGAKLDAAQLAALQRDPAVAAIEPNQVVHANAIQSPTPNWGVDRIDQRPLPLTNSYTYFNNGTGVTAYVIDTGIWPTHPDFGGRAAVAFDATGGNGIDCNGHGTHGAGLIGSATYGVAKNVQLRGVRVLNCAGSGSIAQVIAGVNWVQANSPGPSVALMALGGGASTALNNAVDALAASGVFVAVSGGSSSTNACTSSPAGAPGAYAVVRSTQTDLAPSTNNYGPCIKIHAPGNLNPSTWINNGVQTLSGTSMAAAHVAGVAAMFKDAVGETPSPVVGAWISGVGTAGVLTGVHPQNPNLLLHTNVI